MPHHLVSPVGSAKGRSLVYFFLNSVLRTAPQFRHLAPSLLRWSGYYANLRPSRRCHHGVEDDSVGHTYIRPFGLLFWHCDNIYCPPLSSGYLRTKLGLFRNVSERAHTILQRIWPLIKRRDLASAFQWQSRSRMFLHVLGRALCRRRSAFYVFGTQSVRVVIYTEVVAASRIRVGQCESELADTRIHFQMQLSRPGTTVAIGDDNVESGCTMG